MALLLPKQLPGVQQLLFFLNGANMNVTTDQIFNAVNGMDAETPHEIEHIICGNASISLTLAAGGIYSAAAKAGDAIVAAGQAYSALTGPTLGLALTLAAVGRRMRRSGIPILSLTTAQGAAATADFRIVGRIIPPGA